MKKIMNEFKVFIMRGNVLDLAIGVIIGGAFQKIVNSLVNDIIMPIISLINGGINFSDAFICMGCDFTHLADAQQAGANTLNYGLFITEVLNFLIMAFVIFMMVKTMNRVADKMKKPQEPTVEEPKTKVCPYCKSEVDIEATRCPHCTSEL